MAERVIEYIVEGLHGHRRHLAQGKASRAEPSAAARARRQRRPNAARRTTGQDVGGAFEDTARPHHRNDSCLAKTGDSGVSGGLGVHVFLPGNIL